MQEQKINLHQERDFGEVINVTIQFIKQNIVILGKAIMFFVVPLSIIAGVLYGVSQYYTLGEAVSRTPNVGIGAVVTIFLGILMIIVFTLLQSIVLEFFNEYRENGPDNMTLESIWSRGKESFGTVLGTSIILGLIFMGVALVMGLLALITPYILIALVIPFIYGLVTIYFVYPIRVYENAGMGEAISRSFMLIKDNWWWTFLLYFIISIIAGLLSSIFVLPQYIYTMAKAFTAASGDGASISMTVTILTGVLTLIGQTIFNSIPFIALVFHYYNLLEKKDKPGLHSRLDNLIEEKPANEN